MPYLLFAGLLGTLHTVYILYMFRPIYSCFRSCKKYAKPTCLTLTSLYLLTSK